MSKKSKASYRTQSDQVPDQDALNHEPALSPETTAPVEEPVAAPQRENDTSPHTEAEIVPLAPVEKIPPARAEEPAQETTQLTGIAKQPDTAPGDERLDRPAVKPRRKVRLLVLLLAGILVLGVYTVYRNLHQTSAAATADLVTEVSRRAVLPAGETPAISTVIDETKLDQPFLAQARKGDKVLLYLQSGRAVVYRPSSGQIVNMGPLETPKPRVFVRDGRPDAIPEDFEQRLTANGDFIVASRDSSSRKKYGRTIVVDLSGSRPDVARTLADRLGAVVAALPEGESRPEADLLVIVGSDRK